MTADACPRCGGPLPPAGFYGPCPACRTALRSDAVADFDRRLTAVAGALADGWSWDPDGRWVNETPDETPTERRSSASKRRAGRRHPNPTPDAFQGRVAPVPFQPDPHTHTHADTGAPR